MTDNKPCKKRVVMAKGVAERWLKNASAPEYRLTVYESGTSKPIRNIVNLLRSFRDGKAKISSINTISDLGIGTEDSAGAVTIWSTNHAELLKLDKWLTDRGFLSTGIW